MVSSDPKYDDKDSFKVLMDHEPNGTPVKSILHYAQIMKEDRFQVWAPNYNNIVPFTSDKKTDLIPIENINKVPIAMFVGKNDKLADPTDAEWTRNTIGSDVFHYQEINGGHLTFFIAKDMTWFNEDLMDLIKEYQPLPTTAYLQ